MNKLKIVFCGTPKIGATILETLCEMENVEVVLVISQPDRKIGRNKVLTPTPVKEVALKNNLKIIQPIKISEEFEIIKKLEPDFIVTCAYGQFIPTKILNIPKIDSINLHGSLLPKYRGGAPIQYAIWNGEKETGMSIMKMVKEMDAGGYYIQKSIPITDEDDSGSMFHKLAILGSELIKQNLFKIASGELKLTEQNNEQVSFSKNISSEEEKINWNEQNTRVFNQIRALQPWPIPHTFKNDQRYKIGKTIKIDGDSSKFIAGEIVDISKDGIKVACKSGFINILEIQRPGKPMMEVKQIISGNIDDLKIGSIFN